MVLVMGYVVNVIPYILNNGVDDFFCVFSNKMSFFLLNRLSEKFFELNAIYEGMTNIESDGFLMIWTCHAMFSIRYTNSKRH